MRWRRREGNVLLIWENSRCLRHYLPDRKDTSQVTRYGRIAPDFDESNLVSHAGLVPVLALADRAGLAELIGKHVTLPAANVGVKARTPQTGNVVGLNSDGLVGSHVNLGEVARYEPGEGHGRIWPAWVRGTEDEGGGVQLWSRSRRAVARSGRRRG